MASIRNSKGLYWGLIIAFFTLYLCVGFVSTLHSITFFGLANVLWMAVLLGVTYEIGQASVLFSILMSKNSQKILPWLLMILLTALQVTANVYASFKFMDSGGSMDWTYWQRSILFWLEVEGSEMFKIVISWISGALLPIVALGMTALVADNLKMKDEEDAEEKLKEDKEDKEEKPDNLELNTKFNIPSTVFSNKDRTTKIDELEPEQLEQSDSISDGVWNEYIDSLKKPDSSKTFAEELITNKDSQEEIKKSEVKKTEDDVIIVKSTDDKISDDSIEEDTEKIKEDIDDNVKQDEEKSSKTLFEKKPINNRRGWHLQKEFVDTNGDVYHFGQFQPEEKRKKEKEKKPSKKVKG